jgi:hypothetical protein
MGAAEAARRARLMATPGAVQLDTLAYSIGAEVRAHFAKAGEGTAIPSPHRSFELGEQSLHAPNIGHGVRECPGQKLPESFSQ